MTAATYEIECPICNGEGSIETMIPARACDVEPRSRVTPCDRCDGLGEITVDADTRRLLEAAGGNVEAELAATKRTLEVARDGIATRSTRIAELEESLTTERAGAETVCGELRRTVEEQSRKFDELRQTLDDARATAETLRAEKSAATERIEELARTLATDRAAAEALRLAAADTVAALNGRVDETGRMLAAEQAASEAKDRTIAELRRNLAAADASAETARSEKDAAVAGLTREIAELVQKLAEHDRKPKIEVVHEVEVVSNDPQPGAPADKKKSDFVSLETQLMQELNRVQSGKAAGGARKGFGFFSGKE